MEGVRVDAEDSEGRVALRVVAKAGRADLVQLLLTDYGAHVNLQDKHSGDTALHIACKSRSNKAVRILVKHGADCTLQNKAKSTAQDILRTRSPKLADWLQTRSSEEAAQDSTEKGDKLVQA